MNPVAPVLSRVVQKCFEDLAEWFYVKKNRSTPRAAIKHKVAASMSAEEKAEVSLGRRFLKAKHGCEAFRTRKTVSKKKAYIINQASYDALNERFPGLFNGTGSFDASLIPQQQQQQPADPTQERRYTDALAVAAAAATLTGDIDPTKPAVDGDEARAVKRPRLIWTQALHRRFLESVEKCGGLDHAHPKAIMKEMGVNGLTRENVASHMHNYRMRLKKEDVGGPSEFEIGGAATVAAGDREDIDGFIEDSEEEDETTREDNRSEATDAKTEESEDEEAIEYDDVDSETTEEKSDEGEEQRSVPPPPELINIDVPSPLVPVSRSS